jgi:hypothetical protein
MQSKRYTALAEFAVHKTPTFQKISLFEMSISTLIYCFAFAHIILLTTLEVKTITLSELFPYPKILPAKQKFPRRNLK